MKQIIVQSLVSSTQTAVIKGNKLVELLIEEKKYEEITTPPKKSALKRYYNE